MIKLAAIPDRYYSDYRYEVVFQAYKWDPQVEDHNTVSRHALLLDQETATKLEQWAEQLAEETVRMEQALISRPDLARQLGLPKKICSALPRLSAYRFDQHIRLMRFDFHPTVTGWAVSEVNSDVPGGLAEACVLPRLAGGFFEKWEPRHHVARSLSNAFREKIGEGGRIAFVHATSYSDDRQVMQFLSDHFVDEGFRAFPAAPDHLRFDCRRAVSILQGEEGAVDGIVRFFPLEWLVSLPPASGWKGYYDCETPSCNHPAAVFAQSKRLPLIWDRLGVEIPTWRQLLPRTVPPRSVDQTDTGWVFKPALGRVGEGISIPEAVTHKELRRIRKMARADSKQWIAQQRFQSLPLPAGKDESYHLCVGVFTVDGKCAGFYGRISPYPRIDARAKDIPILVAKEDGDD